MFTVRWAETASGADLGGSSNYSSEYLRAEEEMVSMKTKIGHGLVGPKGNYWSD